MHFGKINKLILSINWKNNFSTTTEITVEGVTVLLSLIEPSQWEYLDYHSYESKLQQLISYANKQYAQLTEEFNSIYSGSSSSSSYYSQILLKIMDNLHVVIKDIHIRIEEPHNDVTMYSLGLTLNELLIRNTNEKWEHHFIKRNVNIKTNMYKLINITNFGVYL